MNKLDFAGRNAIVTGGAQGIGAAIVKRLQASGAKVTVWDLDGSPKVDVADPASIAKALKAIDKVDVLVNNAGVAGMNKPTVDSRSRNGSACCASTSPASSSAAARSRR